MNATTAAAEALTAVQADPVLGRLEWEAMGQYKIAAAQPFPVALKFDFLGQWSATVAGVYLLDEEVRVVRTRFCLTMVDLASAEVSRTLAACRAVDPEVARLRAELEAAQAELALRKQNDADWQAERDAVAQEAATAYARGWQDGRDADALTPPGVTEPAAERGGGDGNDSAGRAVFSGRAWEVWEWLGRDVYCAETVTDNTDGGADGGVCGDGDLCTKEVNTP